MQQQKWIRWKEGGKHGSEGGAEEVACMRRERGREFIENEECRVNGGGREGGGGLKEIKVLSAAAVVVVLKQLLADSYARHFPDEFPGSYS